MIHMPTIIPDDDSIFVNSRTGRSNDPYPWDDWMDGQTRIFTMGEDFNTVPRDFARQAHRAAWKRGLRAQTSRDKTTVTFRAVPRNTE